MTDDDAYTEYLREAIRTMSKPLSMQDIRLVAGEGKLTANDVLRAVNVIRAQGGRVYGADQQRQEKS